MGNYIVPVQGDRIEILESLLSALTSRSADVQLQLKQPDIAHKLVEEARPVSHVH